MVEDLAFHVADLVENALRAGAKLVAVELAREGEVFRIRVEDDGAGMAEDQLRRAGDPFFTTKPGRRVGLGLAFLRQTAEELGGSFQIHSEPGKGTLVEARIPWDHPDRPPLGDLSGTLLPLIVTSPVGFRLVFSRLPVRMDLGHPRVKKGLGAGAFHRS